MKPIPFAKRVSLAVILFACMIAFRQGRNFWILPDQRGQRLYDAGDFQEAAIAFSDPFRRAASLAEARDFKAAAGVYATLPGPEAAFNHGNALVMQGDYETAIRRYDRALELRPDWTAAIENRQIAALRAERMKDEPGVGTEGELGADEIVFDLDNNKNAQAGEEDAESGEASDDEVRLAWLRQVQTTPRDFLKSKFAYQQAMRSRTENAQEHAPESEQ
ncbi:Tetratricopeptide repeat protein [Rubripirellula tenax]|uniref:Tetratricopeptide repeat protein n=1 Tax=Rubripirellula tenax TaxID=2528015 RepID=A0A5C6FCY1_9BACT|nr:tetratricopeptide repeat protein [Rubripirellula tenax]TWU58582.1 Tetratricopeptide repeat protein [Rubripirellula tenax]